ncbi:MAG: response regulator transcription factor [Pirellulaceae bacterium]
MSQPRHILIVEDEHHLSVGIQFNLEAEYYRVTVVDDGRKALQLFGNGEADFDLIILDLMLPGMSGYALCEQLRQDGVTIPILILSARTLAEDKARGFDVGANQYLVKPFELDELLSRVKNLLTIGNSQFVRAETSPEETPKADKYEFGECRIDFQTYEVEVRGEAARLTALQMKLLKYFIANEGRVIPRQELLENVWEMPGNMQTRAPDQFISLLRKTFEKDPASPRHFLTIRDAGYRFVAMPQDD